MNNESTTKKPTTNLESVLEPIKKDIKEMWDEISKYFFTEPKTIDEIVGIYSKIIDKLIVNSEKKENIFFKGGKFIISSISNNDINVKAELFFQDSSNNWVKKEMTNNIGKNHIEELSFKKMIEKNIEEFKIYHPNK